MNFFEDREAQPIKNPSSSEIEANKHIFLSLTDPPYNILGKFFVLKIFIHDSLITLTIIFNSPIFGI